MPEVYSTTATNPAACPRLVCRGNYATFSFLFFLSFSRFLCGVRLSLSLSLSRKRTHTYTQMHAFFFAYSLVRSLQFHQHRPVYWNKIARRGDIRSYLPGCPAPGTGSPLSGNYKNLVRLAIWRVLAGGVLSISCQNPAEPGVLFWKYKLSADRRGDWGWAGRRLRTYRSTGWWKMNFRRCF